MRKCVGGTLQLAAPAAACRVSFSAHGPCGQESMDRTSSLRPEELIVPGFQRSANQDVPHHHGNSPLMSDLFGGVNI
ncbi:hypothetical protein EYF80_034924 [Liparis tanakae]|uniref:Uncharacterized protein n=1 Tax=Liparis tanakae TaxID=230148 RepID=A0A4Z2GQ26_9TELE|nr:hypothetical protein EYF80_034924 [Liparis tanakae]